jgi:imidazolonepropionase
MLQYIKVSTAGTILIRGARQLLTLRGPKEARRAAALNDLGIIQDGSLLIRDGIIEEVGTSRRVENLACARDAMEINAAGRVVMPGFVDCHTHLVFPPLGGSDADEQTAARLVCSSTGQRLEARARNHVEAMARHGTTTVEAKTGCGGDESAEIKILRVLSALKRDPLDVVTTFLLRLPSNGSGEEARRRAFESVFTELLPKIRRRRLARFADLVWDSDGAFPECFARYLRLARGLGFACKIHADQRSPAAAIAAAVENLVVSIDHLEHATAEDALPLSGSPTMATLLPAVFLHNGDRHAPARALIDSGAAIALATNFNPRHTPMLSMQAVVALACLHMGLTAAEAISAATINGAHALGCADRVGSLEPGKSADLLLLDVSDYRELGRQFGVNLVRLTMKRGKPIYKAGEVARRPRTFPGVGDKVRQ